MSASLRRRRGGGYEAAMRRQGKVTSANIILGRIWGSSIGREGFPPGSHRFYLSTTTMLRRSGPWTPRVRVSSMPQVRLGPVSRVMLVGVKSGKLNRS